MSIRSIRGCPSLVATKTQIPACVYHPNHDGEDILRRGGGILPQLLFAPLRALRGKTSGHATTDHTDITDRIPPSVNSPRLQPQPHRRRLGWNICSEPFEQKGGKTGGIEICIIRVRSCAFVVPPREALSHHDLQPIRVNPRPSVVEKIAERFGKAFGRSALVTVRGRHTRGGDEAGCLVHNGGSLRGRSFPKAQRSESVHHGFHRSHGWQAKA